MAKTSIDIKISPSTHNRLNRHMDHAESIDSAINRALDALESGADASRDGPEDDIREISHRNIPSLAHTKVSRARINGEMFNPPDCSWNHLLRRLVAIAADRGMDLDEIRTGRRVGAVRGRLNERGYVPVPGAGISVLNVDANTAGKAMIGLAKDLDIELDIRFEWRRKEGAARPGRSAKLLVPEGAKA